MSVVFNEDEIAPQGAILCITWTILWFLWFGARFQFQWSDFGR